MIKIKKNPETREATCPNCKSTLEYERSDVQKANSGEPFIMCPICQLHVWLDEEEKHITSENLNYPQDFYRFGGAEAVKIDDKQTQAWYREALRNLEADKSEAFYFTGSGDTMVIGLRVDGDIELYVAHGYDNCTVFKEEEEK